MSNPKRPDNTRPLQRAAHDALEQAQFVARLVAETAPSAYSIGKHLARVEDAHHLYDIANLEAFKAAGEGGKLDTEISLLWDRGETLRDLLATLPAAGIRDAAALVAEAIIVADRMNANKMEEEEVERESAKLVRMLTTSLPWIAKAANLEICEMGWLERCDRERRLFSAVGVPPNVCEGDPS